MQFFKPFLVPLSLFLLSIAVYSQGLSIHGFEYRDDEIFYVRSTQEMVENQNYLSPTYMGEDRFQKPILFYWFIIASYKVLGVNWYAARWVAVFFAGLTIVALWFLAKRLFDEKTALLSAFIMMTLPLFVRHAKNSVPDMPLNFFIVTSLLFFVLFLDAVRAQKNQQENWFQRLFFLSCAAGFMVKGYTAVIIPLGTVLGYLLLTGETALRRRLKWGQGIVICLLVAAPWFLYMTWEHGNHYWAHMFMHETKERLVSNQEGSALFNKFFETLSHVQFYAGVLLIYFFPWSPLLALAIPAAVRSRQSVYNHHKGILFCLVWFLGGLLFFACISFAISHYLLVLSAPFSMLIAYFLLNMETRVNPFINWIEQFSKRTYFLVVFSATFFIVTVFLVFFIGLAHQWLVILFVLYVIFLVIMFRSKGSMFMPIGLAVFLLILFSQSHLLAYVGLTQHATLQQLAKVLHEESGGDSIVSVGSHDIHEKELQVYFEQPVEKHAVDRQDVTMPMLKDLFNTTQEVLCVMTYNDYMAFKQFAVHVPLYVIAEGMMPKRRVKVDLSFINAFVRLNRDHIYQEVMEKIVVVKKGANAY